MIYKLIWKDYKKQIKDYIPLFLSIALSTVLINVVFYANIIGIQLIKKGYMDLYSFKTPALSMPIIIILSAYMISYTLKHYISRRSTSYQLFQILGIQTKVMKKLLFFEFCCGGLFSIAVGTLMGVAAMRLLNDVIQEVFISNVLKISWFKTILYSFLTSTIICFGLLLWNYLQISRKSISQWTNSILSPSSKSIGKIDKVCFTSGIIMTVAGTWFLSPFFITRFIGYDLIRLAGIPIYLAGWSLSFLFGMKILLNLLKRRKKFYYPRLLNISNLHTQFRQNSKLLVSVFLVYLSLYTIFFNFLFLKLPLAEAPPLPYNIVWADAQSDAPDIKEIEQSYHGETTLFAYCPVFIDNTGNGGPFTGIPEAAYRELTGKTAALKDDEVLCVSQGGSHFVYSDKVILSFGDEFDFVQKKTDAVTYRLKGKELAYIFSDMGDLVVVSDQSFQEMTAKIGGEKYMAVQSFPDTQRIDAQRKALEAKGRYETLSRSGVYCDVFEQQINLMTNTIISILLGVFCLSLLLYSLYFLGIRLWNRIPEWQRQDHFLIYQGMKYKDRKKIVINEMRLLMLLPFVLALSGWLLYAALDCLYIGITLDNISGAFISWLIIGLMILCHGILQVLYYIYLKAYVKKAIWG